jgi:hypothetical protein
MANVGFRHCSQLPSREASRHSHTQRMTATINAIQLTPIGIVIVPTVTCAWLISRTTCPTAKMAKITLATRNPVLGEFMSRLLNLRGDLSAKMRRL